MKEQNKTEFTWPVRCFPEIVNAVKVPFDDRGFLKNYCSGNHHALHLYEYHGKMRLGDREVEITPGTMSISPRNTNSSYDLQERGYHYCIHFCPGFSSGNETLDFPCFFPSGTHHQEAVLRFMEIVGMLMYAKGENKKQARVSLAFQSFMLWLNTIIHDDSAEANLGNPIVNKVVDLIEQNLTEKLSVPAIAREAKVSQNYLATLFKQQFGMTIPHFVLTRRIEYAKTLLEISDMKVKEVADRSGLSDPQYFNKQFRRIVGIAPTEYRKVISV